MENENTEKVRTILIKEIKELEKKIGIRPISKFSDWSLGGLAQYHDGLNELIEIQIQNQCFILYSQG